MKGNGLKIFILLYIFLSGVFLSCSEMDGDQFRQLKYGTSFNMCVGYCRNEMVVESGAVTYYRTGWADTVEPITCLDVLGKDDWAYLNTHLNILSFFNLPETLGCPDCADGGAEWIEVELLNGKKHRVTFEFSNEPEVIREYIEELRIIMSHSPQCGEF